GAFDEFGGCFAWCALGEAGFLGSFAGAFVLDVADRQPQQFGRGGVVGEVAAVLDDLAQLVVQRLDAVGGVDDLAQRWPERQERGEPVPRVLPGGDRGRVLLAPGSSQRTLSAPSTRRPRWVRCRSGAASPRRPCGRCRTRTACWPGSGA